MLETLIVVILFLYLLGLVGHVGGGLIHLLLIVAACIIIIRALQGRNIT